MEQFRSSAGQGVDVSFKGESMYPYQEDKCSIILDALKWVDWGIEKLSSNSSSSSTSAVASIFTPKFQEVAALAFFNWENVHMCAARKRIPLDESTAKDVMATQLQVVYDWVREKYSLVREE